MAKVTRHFTIPNELLKLYEGVGMSRSAGIAFAISEARKHPTKLAKALNRRVSHNSKVGNDLKSATEAVTSDLGTTKVTLYVDESVLEDASYLEKVTGLPKEVVIRLSMEAHVHDL